MSEDQQDLRDRLEKLERLVQELVVEVQRSRSQPAAQQGAPRRRSPERDVADPPPYKARPDRSGQAPPRPAPQPRPSLSEQLASQGERWLGRIGIGFVILAVAFLLKLGFDRGWITPLFRLILGGGIGTALLLVGLRIEPRTGRLGQALLGGSIAVFYLVSWAGFELYDLMSFVLAFSLMTATTVLAIALAERRESAFLAVIGVSGGLATPFLLDTGSGNVIALAAYAALVLLGGGVVQYRRGWQTLLGTLNLGGALTLVAVSIGLEDRAPWVPLLAVSIFWLVGGLSPAFRRVRAAEATADQPTKPHETPEELVVRRVALYWSTGMTAILIRALFELEAWVFASVWLGMAALLAAGAAAYRDRPDVVAPPAEAAAMTFLIALWVWPGDQISIVLVAAASAALLVLHRRRWPGRLVTVAHLSFVVVALAFFVFSLGADLEGFLNLRDGTFPRLGAVMLAAVASLWLATPAQRLYRALAYLALLLWSWSTLDPLANGAALVSIAWTLQGAATLLVSIKRRSQILQFTGLATIVLVAAKMLVIDLSEMDPVWRILLFMGFGIGLLGLAWLSNRPGPAGADEGES